MVNWVLKNIGIMLQNVEIKSGTLYIIRKSTWSSSSLHQLAFCEIGNFCKKESTSSDNGHCAEIIGILYRHILYHYLYSRADFCRKPSLDEMFDDVTRIISLSINTPRKDLCYPWHRNYFTPYKWRYQIQLFIISCMFSKEAGCSLIVYENITSDHILIIWLYFEWYLDTIYPSYTLYK